MDGKETSVNTCVIYSLKMILNSLLVIVFLTLGLYKCILHIQNDKFNLKFPRF